MRSVWSIPTPPASEKLQGKHPTQKPLDLLDRILSASTNPGDLVLDPFSGSGTTGLSALRGDRAFIGIEKEAAYLQLAVDRFTTAPLPGSEITEGDRVLANGKPSNKPSSKTRNQPNRKTANPPTGASTLDPSSPKPSHPSSPSQPNH
jgi:hypothetical protein